MVLAAMGLCWMSISVHGQHDPSSQILLRSGSSSPSRETLDSSRYTVRPSEGRSESVLLPERRSDSSDKAVIKVKEDQPVKIEGEAQPATGDVKIDETSVPSAEVVESEQSSGGLHRLDPRRNTAELSFAPTYFYNESTSSYWFRHYRSSGPALDLSAHIWLSPSLGLFSSYRMSLNSSINGEPSGHRSISVEHQWLDLGLRYRHSFGTYRKAPRILLGVDYSEYKLKVPAGDPYRVRLRTSGVRLTLEALVPSSLTYYQWYGVEVLPRANHEEISTGSTARSGAKNRSDVIGAFIGGQFLLDRQNQIFWRLRHRVEKNLFEGETTVQDPRRGEALQGVDVTNSLTLIEFGYRWGG